MTTGIDAAADARPGRMPGIPRPQPRPARAAPGQSRARQDAGYPEGLSLQGAAPKASAAKARMPSG